MVEQITKRTANVTCRQNYGNIFQIHEQDSEATERLLILLLRVATLIKVFFFFLTFVTHVTFSILHYLILLLWIFHILVFLQQLSNFNLDAYMFVCVLIF